MGNWKTTFFSSFIITTQATIRHPSPFFRWKYQMSLLPSPAPAFALEKRIIIDNVFFSREKRENRDRTWGNEGCTSQVFLLHSAFNLLSCYLKPFLTLQCADEKLSFSMPHSTVLPASARLVIFSQFSTDDDVILLLVVCVLEKLK